MQGYFIKMYFFTEIFKEMAFGNGVIWQVTEWTSGNRGDIGISSGIKPDII